MICSIYYVYRKEIDRIILNDIDDCEEIERLLNEMKILLFLDEIYTLYSELCYYYNKINKIYAEIYLSEITSNKTLLRKKIGNKDNGTV